MTILVTNRDLSESRRLEEALLGAIEDEQRRIGRDLHDGLGQELTAIGMLNSVVHKGLEVKGHSEAETLAKLGGLLKRASSEVRRISHGLQPVAAEPGALMSGLKQLVTGSVALHGVSARFECPTSVEIPDPGVANHLFRIAQEAVQNALRHAHPKNITVRLSKDGARVRMEIEDDGPGITRERAGGSHGIGLNTMKYRANAMGGFLQVLRPETGGTLIRCLVPPAQEMLQKAKPRRRRAAS
jgi:signal transduction histidine kinase